MDNWSELQKDVRCNLNKGEEDMANWSEFQKDVLGSIARLLTVATDRAGFSGVCRNWYSLAQSETNYLPCSPPWLMLVEKSDDSNLRGFVGLTDASAGKESFELYLPEVAKGTRCVGSNGCWVVMIDANCNMFALNPFSRAKIELPPLQAFEDFKNFYQRDPSRMTNLFIRDWFIKGKVVLSFPTTKSPATEEDFIALAIFDASDPMMLAYTRKGSKSWTTIEPDDNKLFDNRLFDNRLFFDVQFYQDKFYAVNGKGVVFELGISFSPTPCEKPKLKPISDRLRDNTGFPQRYLVEFQGKLLQVVRKVGHIEESLVTVGEKEFYERRTKSVHVFQLDFVTGGWVEVNDLGQHSIFVGSNRSVSLLASSNSTFKPNCIYFTDDSRSGCCVGNPFQGGTDMGIFNLADCTIEPHYTGRCSLSSFSPPIWVIPTSFHQGIH